MLINRLRSCDCSNLLFSDCNIATERRKDSQQERRGGFSSRGSNRRQHSPSPPYRHRDRYEMEHHSRYERGGWRGSPPPMGPPLRERDRDHYFDRYLPPPIREPYSRPRDDPYERYGRERERFPPPLPPPRDFHSYGGPRDLPSPRERYPSDYPPRWGSPEFDHRGPERERHLSLERERDWERERRPRLEAPPPKQDVGRDRRPVDMEIIVINRQQRLACCEKGVIARPLCTLQVDNTIHCALSAHVMPVFQITHI